MTEANNPDEALKNPHKLKPLPELRKLFESRGVTPDKLVVVSCSTGREASLQYVILKHLLGYPKVRLYEGSWTEYSATNHPLQTGPETAKVSAAPPTPTLPIATSATSTLPIATSATASLPNSTSATSTLPIATSATGSQLRTVSRSQ